MTNIKKIVIISLYFIAYWIILPVLIIYFSKSIDIYFNFEQIQSYSLKTIGLILTIISFPMLLLSIIQFKQISGKFPVSALPPKNIIQDKIFAIWRHPIYLFYVLTFWGIGMFMQSKAMLYHVLPGFTLVVAIYIYFEERILLKKYGKNYITYKKRVSLIIPKLFQVLKIPAYIFFKLKFSYRAINRRNIPSSPPFFVIAAHKSYLDPFYISLAINFPVQYVTTYEVFRNKTMRTFLKKFYSIPKKRYLKDSVATKEVINRLAQQSVIGIFPEGERSWTGEQQSFIPDTIKLFKKYYHIPILPVILEGNYAIWPRWGNNLRKAKLNVLFKEPLYIDQTKSNEEIEQQLITIINPISTTQHLTKTKTINNNLPIVIYRCPECLTFESLKLVGYVEMRCSNCSTHYQIAQSYDIKYKNISKSISEIYDEIKISMNDIESIKNNDTIPDFIKREDVIITQSNNCMVSKEIDGSLQQIMNGKLYLTKNYIYISGNSEIIKIELKNLCSSTTESNNKLQLYDIVNKMLYMLKFEKDSVLKWQDYIQLIIKKEYKRSIITR